MNDSGATVLETERLVLRHLTRGDLDELAALYRDSEVRRYLSEGTLTYEETREELEWCIDVYDGLYRYGLWATVRPAFVASSLMPHGPASDRERRRGGREQRATDREESDTPHAVSRPFTGLRATGRDARDLRRRGCPRTRPAGRTR